MSGTTHHLDAMAAAIDDLHLELNRVSGVPQSLRFAMDRARAKAIAARKWSDAQGAVQRSLFDDTPVDPNPVPYSDPSTSLYAARRTLQSGSATVNMMSILAMLEARQKMGDEVCLELEARERSAGRPPRPWQSTVCSRLNALENKRYISRPGDEGRTRTGSKAKYYKITPSGLEALADWRETR